MFLSVPSAPAATPHASRWRGGRVEPHRGTLILVLGILSFFAVPFVLGPVAWALGSADLRAMREGRMDPAGESSTNAGRLCGKIISCFWLIAIGLILLHVFFIW